ncbi:hypothetical protein KEJ15_02310 [Candidatus Bathyarchaeota archaeon]|nr:hypothetical protein [Candidatus Bathyarchaeota archaeon]
MAFIGGSPALIPAYPWLYAMLTILTAFIVFCTFALSYIKIYVSTKGLLIEAPFLNYFKCYEANNIYGFTVTKEKKQRWFLLNPIPLFVPRKKIK